VTVTRDTVLLAGDETDDAVAEALGLDAIPFEGMTVGDLVDDVNRYRGNLEALIYAVTGGALSKAGWGEDTDAVVEAGAPVAMRAFVHQYPSLLDCEPFRAAVDQWFGPELLAGMEADRRPINVGTGP
jgi:hypothetical protein